MPSLRDEITNTIRRLRGRTVSKPELDETTVLATDPREGRQYGNYRVLRRLGAGGMGHVYLALDTHLGRHAALKFLSPKLKSAPEMLTRLQQEARTASSLNHPNILTIYDIAEADGEPFIASEFIDGVTLRQALERDAIQPADALDIAIQIASALKPAHDAGIIHRDLKPGNVMLRPDGLVKVIDFGLAKFTAQGHVAPRYEPLSDPGSVAGTIQYMSPEQARGDEVDGRTDLWSLGVMLYEMVAQKKPFDGETESHIIVAILDRQQSELKTTAGVPTGLSSVVEKALAKRTEKRYQNAEEMLSALKVLQAASRPSRIYGSSLLKKRGARRHWFMALACAIAAMVLALWWWPFHGREAVLGPAWFVPANYFQITHSGDVDLVALSPNGRRVAYTTTNNGQTQLHLFNLDTHSDWTWPPYAGNTLGLMFSRDSSTIYYTVHDQREWGRLYAAKENTADPVFVLEDVDGTVAFSPDGSEFAFRRRIDDKRTNRESIVVVKANDTGDQRTILTKYNTSLGTRMAWSSAGTLAVNLNKRGLDAEGRPTVLTFARNGSGLVEYSDSSLRSLSGPEWLDYGSMLIFTGFNRGGDEKQSTIVELSLATGQFRFFSSPALTPNSMSASRDFKKVAAVMSTAASSLLVASAGHLDSPEQWTASDYFDSFTWNSNDSIVYPSARGGDIALWEARQGRKFRVLPHSNDCLSRQPAQAPGQPFLVFASNCDAGANASNLWILNENNGKLTRITDHSHSDAKPVVAPDGDTVLYNSWPNNDPALMRFSLQTHAKSQFTSLQARNAAISPDGRNVACQIRENYDGQWRVALLSMRDGAIEKDNLPLPAQLNSVIRWSPDGKALDYVGKDDEANLWRLPLDGTPARPLTHLSGNPITSFAWNDNGTRLAWVSSDVRRDVIIFQIASE